MTNLKKIMTFGLMKDLLFCILWAGLLVWVMRSSVQKVSSIRTDNYVKHFFILLISEYREKCQKVIVSGLYDWSDALPDLFPSWVQHICLIILNF